MKKILFLFLAACFFFSCEKETIVIPQQHAGRTVLAFFWADNSLNSSLRNNIQTMMQGLQAMKDSAALLVYWDGEASDIKLAGALYRRICNQWSGGYQQPV